jgi:spore germination cell wall hydrolase CwlJ-like protein
MERLMITCSLLVLVIALVASIWPFSAKAKGKPITIKKGLSTLSDFDLIAQTLYYECAREPLAGKHAVASVILNRKGEKGTWKGVILRPKQFSCWNRRKVGYGKLPYNSDAVVCEVIARNLVESNFTATGPWTHYYNPSLCNPSWGPDMTSVKGIGHHRFGVTL